LPPAENDVAWKVENNGNSIVSMTTQDFDFETNSINSFRVNFMNFGPNIRERELKRRFNEIN